MSHSRHKAVTHTCASRGYAVLGGKHAGVPRGNRFSGFGTAREVRISARFVVAASALAACARFRQVFRTESVRANRCDERPVRRPADFLWARLGLVLVTVALAGTASAGAGGEQRGSHCLSLKDDAAYDQSVFEALAAKRDVWGDDVLQTPAGPTYDGVHGRLHPLMLVGRPAGLKPTRLTDSGVYYLAFGQPRGPGGAGAVQLHVADGSQIVSELVSGPKLTISIGATGAERYGACLARLATPRLNGGYLPILETSYVDRDGARYEQESFAARIPGVHSLVSFVQLTVDPSGTRRGTVLLRFRPSVSGLHRGRRQLWLGRRARLLFSPGARFDGRSLVYVARRRRTVYVAWLDRPERVRHLRAGPVAYGRAKASLVDYWARRLAAGAELVVPEQRVYDAERNLLIQNMLMSWRYSLGNSYERFSWELVDVAEVMGAYGYRGIQRRILEAALRAPSSFPNRAAGERMAGAADYFRRFGDRDYVEHVTPYFRLALQSFDRQLDRSASGLLGRERYGSDIAGKIYGLHAQVLALQGLRAMVGVWAARGHPELAWYAARTAERLERGLRAAVATGRAALPDGSVFVPISLVDGREHPYDSLTSSKRGSYWNLVMPYALASRFFRPGGPEARGLLRYLLNHGSRFLGLVRFAPHTGVTNSGYERPGSDDVYGLNVARFLADNDQPDQLLLSLYGKLGTGMTENTFVAGEGATIAPVGKRYYRAMHRPPNSANNAFFLEALRLTLVHEVTDAGGWPQGLELAYATPRGWLEPGKRIEVRRMQTSFGPLSYALDAGRDSVRATLDVPPGLAGSLRLRLRLPAGQRIGGVTIGGEPFARLADPETLDLSGLHGHLEVVVDREAVPTAAARTRR